MRRVERPTMLAGACLAALLVPGGAPARTAGARHARPLHLHATRLAVRPSRLEWRVQAGARFGVGRLAREGRSLCLRLYGGRPRVRDVCVTRTGRLSFARALRRGGDGPRRKVPGRVRRPSDRALVASFSPAAVGLRPGRFRWQAISRARGCTGACAQRLPAKPVPALLRPRLPVGCAVGGPPFRLNGPRARREVALTFDDGPSPYTPGFLRVLERMHAPATFFLLGNQIAGREALVRRMLADGDMVGDHTWDHATVSGDGPHAAWEMSSTRTAIRRASGFTPCLFRAPYGAVSGALIAEARRMAFTTIQWDVDPRDFSLPGSGAIYARDVSAARPGSIIISHDGGGPRGQTLAALPHVIATLRRRGYRLVTVTHLLGLGVRHRG